jgi:hypothetical protein
MNLNQVREFIEVHAGGRGRAMYPTLEFTFCRLDKPVGIQDCVRIETLGSSIRVTPYKGMTRTFSMDRIDDCMFFVNIECQRVIKTIWEQEDITHEIMNNCVGFYISN